METTGNKSAFVELICQLRDFGLSTAANAIRDLERDNVMVASNNHKLRTKLAATQAALKEAREALDFYDSISSFNENRAARTLSAISSDTSALDRYLEMYKSGVCVKCGNPQQDQTKEHFVGATASDGVRTPEDSRPQQVETLHHFSQPGNMVDRTDELDSK